MRDLCTALRINDTLTELSLEHLSLGNMRAKQLANGVIAGHASLLVVNLPGNRISDQGAIALATALKKNTVLRILRLQANDISDNGALAFATAMEENVSLVALELGRVGVHDPTAALLQTQERCSFERVPIPVYVPTVVVPKPQRRLVLSTKCLQRFHVNIGLYAAHLDTPGRIFLSHNAEVPSSMQVRDIVNDVFSSPVFARSIKPTVTQSLSSGFVVFPPALVGLSDQHCQVLIQMIEKYHVSLTCSSVDTKLYLSVERTRTLLSSALVTQLWTLFGVQNYPDQHYVEVRMSFQCDYPLAIVHLLCGFFIICIRLSCVARKQTAVASIFILTTPCALCKLPWLMTRRTMAPDWCSLPLMVGSVRHLALPAVQLCMTTRCDV